jgi:hypothetical protein
MVERWEAAGGTIRRRLETAGRYSRTSLAPAEEEPCCQGRASSCAEEMWPSSTRAGEEGVPSRDATTSCSLGIAGGSASFKGLAREVAVHAAGLVDAPCVHAAAPRALGMAGGCDGASEGVAADVAVGAASECLLHIQAVALLVLEERGCCCGRAAGGGGRGGRAGGRG